MNKKNAFFKLFMATVMVIVLSLSFLSLTSCQFMFDINIDEFADELLEGMFTNDALSVNYLLEDPASYAAEAAEATWPRPMTKTDCQEGSEQMSDFLDLMKIVKYKGAKQEELYHFLTAYFENKSFMFEYYYFQNDYLGSYISVQANIPILLTKYKLRSQTDIDNYLSFMRDAEDAFETYIEYEIEKIDNGYGRSLAFYEGALSQTEAITGVDITTNKPDVSDYTVTPNNHFLQKSFNDKVEDCTFLTQAQKTTVISDATSALQNNFLTAYLKLGLGIQSIIQETPQDQIGAKGLKNYTGGANYYKHLFKAATGSSDSIQTALSKIETAFDSVNTEMAALYMQIQSTMGEAFDIDEAIQTMSATEDWTAEGCASTLAALKAEIQSTYPSFTQNNVVFSYVDESLKDNFSPAAYFQSPIDNLSADESIIINIYNNTGYLLYDILAHEGIPGHMYQAAYLKSKTDMHKILQVLTPVSYAEGWATYSQYVVAGGYSSGSTLENQLYRLYQLDNMSSGYLQSIVDIWVNYEGISLATLNSRLASLYGTSITNISEMGSALFSRVIEVPTNAATYYYSYLKLIEIKNYLVNQKGYSELQFNTAILDTPYTYDQIISIYDVSI